LHCSTTPTPVLLSSLHCITPYFDFADFVSHSSTCWMFDPVFADAIVTAHGFEKM
jgi:hypothetical protein